MEWLVTTWILQVIHRALKRPQSALDGRHPAVHLHQRAPRSSDLKQDIDTTVVGRIAALKALQLPAE